MLCLQVGVPIADQFDLAARELARMRYSFIKISI